MKAVSEAVAQALNSRITPSSGCAGIHPSKEGNFLTE